MSEDKRITPDNLAEILEKEDSNLTGYTFMDDRHFENIVLTEVCLAGADLSGVHFYRCSLFYCDFDSANLTGVHFENCRIDSCEFEDAHLAGVWFDDCVLEDCNFRQAYLNWNSHALLSAILLDRTETVAQELLAVYIGHKTDHCWSNWLDSESPVYTIVPFATAEWALTIFQEYLKPDNSYALPRSFRNYLVDKGIIDLKAETSPF